MTSSTLHPPSSQLLHPDAARHSPLSSPSLTRTNTRSSTNLSRSPSPALSRPVSGASSAPSLGRIRSKISLIPRAKSHSRLSLRYQANTWRFLENVGLYLNAWPKPYPPEPAFIRHFQTSDTPSSSLQLAFYVPSDYEEKKQQGHRFPVVANLHGGGFTLGTVKDDARWAAFVLHETDAVCVSIEYRLAPEFPFPIAVEDGVEALLHLATHAEELALDEKQIALTGFSAGGNLVFTVPLRLQEHVHEMQGKLSTEASGHPDMQPALPNIIGIISFYPALDMRLSRAARRASCPRPDKTLPPILTDLFDESYLPDETAKLSPYASPPCASDDALISGLPQRISFVLCEWDMLLKEGKDFADKLKGLGKEVDLTVVEKTRHAFDKAPCPFGVDPKVALYYGESCKVLREFFEKYRAKKAGAQA